ncbi:epidermal growth factor receptor kinase substrate 8-like protein 3 [Pelodytes ibericus]
MDNYFNAMDGVFAQQGDVPKHSIVSSRPTAKNIYQQRKQYAQTLTMVDSDFQHRVEHLLTCDLDNDLRSVEDCLKRLGELDAGGRIWGQDLILQVKNGELQLNDLETRDSLEIVPLHNVKSCSSVMGGPTYNSILTVTIQEQHKSSIFLFQCEEKPANTLHKNLEKSIAQWKENQESTDNLRKNMTRPFSPVLKPGLNQSPTPSVGWESPKSSRVSRELPSDSPAQQRKLVPENHQPLNAPTFLPPPLNTASDIERDIDILNHVLQDIEKFIGKLSPEKKKKKGKSAIPESEFIDCLQKIKYSFNLMGKQQDQMQQPNAPDLVHILLAALPKILSSCNRKNVTPTVVSPLLTQKAILLLSSSVTDKERQLWESLGDAWMRTRADWPNANNVPQYIPTFSDGWIPPALSSNDDPQMQRNSKTPPTNRHFQPLIMRVMYDFEARNNRELSVRKGDNVKVLDQSRQWWMVEDVQKQTGFIPSNIIDTGDDGQINEGGISMSPNSTPQDVTAWLKERGFSNITVRCLGVLRGEQLLGLSREDLKAVCPEEGGRVFTQLIAVQTGLGM